ncbi:hypothetical protein P692DRAFT_201858186, partial [Suillus brevipes Sb2]
MFSVMLLNHPVFVHYYSHKFVRLRCRCDSHNLNFFCQFNMTMFLRKDPSTHVRVIDVDDCPPHDVEHEIPSYPVYYDPLYYPKYHDAVFATSDSFCAWLQTTLPSHCRSCFVCPPPPATTSVEAASSDVIVRLGHETLLLPKSHFEASTYSHCSIFKQMAILAPHISLVSVLSRDPVWLAHPLSTHAENLSALSAPVLRVAAEAIGCPRSITRVKDRSVQFLLQDFAQRLSEIRVVPDDLLSRRQSATVPPGCLKTRATFIAADIQSVYGDQ